MVDRAGTIDEISRWVRAIVGLRGVLLLLFGLVVLVTPQTALLALVYVFAFYAIIDGIAAIALGIRHRARVPGWAWAVAQGVVSVLAGIAAFLVPGAAALAFLYVIAFWAIVAGVVTGIAANEMRRHDGPWGWVAARAVLDIVIGIMLLVWPASGIAALLWLLGIFAVATGIVLLIQAFRPRHTAIG